MKPFLTEDFLLLTRTARALYHDFAENMPIFDYHCHLPSGGNRREQDLREPHRHLAAGRSLQVAGHAGQRNRRAADHRGRKRFRKVPGMGRHRAPGPCATRFTIGPTWS